MVSNKLEKDVERECRQWVEDQGGIWVKLLADGRKGIPDNEVMLPPVSICGVDFPITLKVELKRPKGGVVSRHQEKWMRDIMNLAHPVFVITSVEELENAVFDVTARIKTSVRLALVKSQGRLSKV